MVRLTRLPPSSSCQPLRRASSTRSAIISIAVSRSRSSHSVPNGRRYLTVVTRVGLVTSCLLALPLGHSRPRLIGESGLPSIWTIFSSFTYTFCAQPTAQYGHTLFATRSAVAVRDTTASVALLRAALPRPSGSVPVSCRYTGQASSHVFTNGTLPPGTRSGRSTTCAGPPGSARLRSSVGAWRPGRRATAPTLPGGRHHVLDGPARLPAQLGADPRGGRHDPRWVTWPPRDDEWLGPRVLRRPGDLPDGLHHLPDGDAGTVPDVRRERGYPPLGQGVRGGDVSGGDVGHVDEVADAGAVGRGVVGTEDQRRETGGQALEHHGDEVRVAPVGEYGRGTAGDVEVAQAGVAQTASRCD